MRTTSLLNKTFVMALSALAFASCTAEQPDEKSQAAELEIFGSLNGVTRAGDSSWDRDDRIGLFVTVNGTQQVQDNANNLQYRYADPSTTHNGSNFVPVGTAAKIWTENDKKKCYIIGYYPYHQTLDADNSFTHDIYDQSDPKKVDLITARTGGVGFAEAMSPVPLVFSHRLSKLSVTVKMADGSAPQRLAASVSNQPSAFRYYPKNDEINVYIPFETIAMHTNAAGNNVSALLVPNTEDMNGPRDRTLTCSCSGFTKNFTIPKNIFFEPGVQYDVELTMGASRSKSAAPVVRVVTSEFR